MAQCSRLTGRKRCCQEKESMENLSIAKTKVETTKKRGRKEADQRMREQQN
jgi:hypothetical protein